MAYKAYDFDAMRREIERDEGRRTQLYQDSVGKWTIGVGCNVQDRGLPAAAIDLIRDIQLEEAEAIVDKVLPQWRLANAPRQRALVNMAFNLGETRLRGFKQMLTAIGNAIQTNSPDWWAEAAKQALDSQWAKQVGVRATRIAETLKSGSTA